jgi:hypothetical protein
MVNIITHDHCANAAQGQVMHWPYLSQEDVNFLNEPS